MRLSIAINFSKVSTSIRASFKILILDIYIYLKSSRGVLKWLVISSKWLKINLNMNLPNIYEYKKDSDLRKPSFSGYLRILLFLLRVSFSYCFFIDSMWCSKSFILFSILVNLFSTSSSIFHASIKYARRCLNTKHRIHLFHLYSVKEQIVKMCYILCYISKSYIGNSLYSVRTCAKNSLIESKMEIIYLAYVND